MKRLGTAAGGVIATIIAAAFVSVLLLSGHALHPTGGIGNAASAARTESPSPTDSPLPSPVAEASPTSKPKPTPTQIATIVNPLPSPTAPPVQTQPSPTPTDPPSPDPSPTPTQAPPPSPSPLPPPSPTPPPVCSWSVTVSTLTSTGAWAPLGTWSDSGASGTSPIFITSGTGWLRYVYQFTQACVGQTTLTSTNSFSGARIYSDAITSTSALTREANLGPNTQVVLTVS